MADQPSTLAKTLQDYIPKVSDADRQRIISEFWAITDPQAKEQYVRRLADDIQFWKTEYERLNSKYLADTKNSWLTTDSLAELWRASSGNLTALRALANQWRQLQTQRQTVTPVAQTATVPTKMASIWWQDYNRFDFVTKDWQTLNTFTKDGKNYVFGNGEPVDFAKYALTGKYISRTPTGWFTTGWWTTTRQPVRKTVSTTPAQTQAWNNRFVIGGANSYTSPMSPRIKESVLPANRVHKTADTTYLTPENMLKWIIWVPAVAYGVDLATKWDTQAAMMDKAKWVQQVAEDLTKKIYESWNPASKWQKAFLKGQQTIYENLVKDAKNAKWIVRQAYDKAAPYIWNLFKQAKSYATVNNVKNLFSNVKAWLKGVWGPGLALADAFALTPENMKKSMEIAIRAAEDSGNEDLVKALKSAQAYEDSYK